MIIKFEMEMPQFEETRRIHMYLPDDYEESEEAYPVLYMFDGHNLFEDEEATYGRSWRLTDHINERKLIIVGVECSHEGDSRLAEYSPFPFADVDFDNVYEPYGEETMEFFVDTLKPYIDENFPTLPERETTWIGGSSCGALMALYAVEEYNEIYSQAICLSPYLQPTYDYMIINTMHTEFLEPTAVYFSWGAQESGKHAFIQETYMITQIANSLMDNGVYVRFNVKPEGEHTEASWEEEAETFLDFLF